MNIVNKIEESKDKGTLYITMENIWVSRQVVDSFLKKNPKKKYDIDILKKLYNHFKLPLYDEFYINNLRLWYPNTKAGLWNYIRNLRISKGFTIWELAKKIKIQEQTLSRLENWHKCPTYDSYTIQHIIKALELNESQKSCIKDFIALKKNKSWTQIWFKFLNDYNK